MSVTDAAGNTGPSTNVLGFTVDSNVPLAPELALSEASDGYLNAAEVASGGGVPAPPSPEIPPMCT
jgi:hypothetical protein